jgi:DNA-binding response OmpR family regulator
MEREGITVLLVDDEVAFTRTLAQRLIMRDLRVIIAHDGEQALSKTQKEKPDVIVLDLNMPGMHGMDVLREIREIYPQIQVIILTGHGTDKDEEEAIRLGGFGFLKKPIEIETLEHKIKAAFKEKNGKTI